MPKRVRVALIVQLCFACCWLLLLFGSPFTGEYWATRGVLLLYETVTGVGEGRFIPEEKLKRHQERFSKLAPHQQEQVLSGYRKLEKEVQIPAMTRLKKAITLILYQEAPFLQAWLVAGLILPFLLLLRKEGSVAAIWLLPVISCCYLLAHFLYSKPLAPSPDAKLFPTEEQLRLFEDPALQGASEYTRMQDSWNRYLLTHYAPKTPLSSSSSTSALEEAEYQFTLARLEAREKNTAYTYSSSFPPRSFLFLRLFFFWNLFLAALVQHAHLQLLSRKDTETENLVSLDPLKT